MERECGSCDGTGYVEAGCWPCETCGASGWVTIPPKFCMAEPDKQSVDKDDVDCGYPNCYCG